MQKNLKHSWKRLLACLLAVVMLVGVAPIADIGDTAIKASAGYTLEQLKSEYPQDSSWKGSYDNASSCHGWALMVADKFYGFSSTDQNRCRNWSKTYNYNNVKSGDVIRHPSSQGGHTAWVIGVSGENLTLAECNFPSNGVIHWGTRTVTKSYLYSLKAQYTGETYTLSAPYDMYDPSHSTPADTENPTISGVYIGQPTDTTFRVCCVCSDNVGISRVDVATWSTWNADGTQADLVWRGCVDNGVGTWFMDIKYSDHAAGATHFYNDFYVYDAAGNWTKMRLEYQVHDKNTAYVLDINPVIDGTSFATGKDGFTFDLYLDGNLIADDAIDYGNLVSEGTRFELKDFRCPSGYSYKGGTITGIVNNDTEIRPTYVSNYSLDINIIVDGVKYATGKTGFTFDLYLDGNMVADDIVDYGNLVSSGTIYEIKDIKYPAGYSYKGGTLTGTVNKNTEITPTFVSNYALDINTVIDGITYATGKTGFTFDLYLDGFLIADDIVDYANLVGSGTTYEIKDIRSPYGFSYVGKAVKGMVKDNTEIKLMFNSEVLEVLFETFCDSIMSPKTVTYGSTYGTLPTPTRTGYTFDGWYTSATGGTKITSSTKVTATGNQTLYAHWTCNHSYTSQIVTAATCCSTGTKKYTCKTCGNTYTETIAKDANNHTGGTELKNAKSATCGETGYTGDTCCKGCSAVLTKGSVIPAAGSHSFGAWKQTKAPTCTAKGEKTRTCSVCGKTETLAVDKIAHTYTATVTEATCTEDGKTVYTCSCGDTYTEVIPSKGHHDEDADGTCDACGQAMSDVSKDCSCRCHKTGLNKFIYKIILIFWKLFRINKTCACGVNHY